MAQTRPSSDGSHGKWHLLHANVGISAMHMQLMHDNKVVIFDRTDFGPSNISLPGGRCRMDPNDAALKIDCTAHSILYDIITDTYRPLMVQTDTWCSSGAVLPNGTLVQTGGFHDGDNVTRMYTPCSNDICDWVEFPNYLSRRRWYATNQILPDGRIIIIGGRREFSYEFFPRLSPRRRTFHLRFLTQTREGSVENNLYPYVHLLPDGNLFIFANTRSILFDYNQNRVMKMKHRIAPEVLVCGGAPRGAYQQALRRTYARAISTCGRIRITDDQNPSWVMETMPIPRVMGDMLLLPTGDVIIINGGQSGTAGWELGRQAATRPVIYRPSNPSDQRFSVMTPSRRPRMYHSAAILLTDGRVLVGGGNPHIYYNFSNVFYPTDLSLETFSPPYLSTQYASIRPVILSVDDTVSPGQSFLLSFSVGEFSSESVLSVRIVAPSFTTHSYSMNQRMVVLRTDEIIDNDKSSYTLSVVGPSSAEIAPPGYYLLFVVHSGIPSSGVWVRIQ
ncbi:GLYOXAL OXIDASE-RELATED PROTEIN [Salix purpurea]|uniref:GLYOXAL OXIDASE-RELATED PROTEIN n=1 Tax=Salix purpurea TaxID=77065 RepID=A0A9Q1A9J6_SALPP|nr:GLYOXAL OXIDASE-RELATED PROTEIN [Salix purpurea]